MAAPVFGRVALFQAPGCIGARKMATLKEIRLRLTSVKNIQKITKSMKMVSAAKFARAERDLRPARVYGDGATALYEKAEIDGDQQKPNKLVVAISSDRGLCGGIHTSVSKAIKAVVAEEPATTNTALVLVGDKVRGILRRTLSKNILMHMHDIGRKPPVFADSSFVAQEIIDSGYEFDSGVMHYNHFRNVASYLTSTKDILSLDAISSSDNIQQYDDVDAEVLRCYYEYTLANIIFYGMKENACSEQSSRMTAMESASKNAGEMIDKLTLSFNRTRQAVITTELGEIVSGAAALE